MVARSENGKIIARVEFTETVQGDEVTMRLTYHFLDGSIDDETTTYSQRGTFRLIRNHHIQNGPFFATPVDFTVEAATGTATSRIADKNGKTRVESSHIDLPDDLANGFVGTLLVNVSLRRRSGTWRSLWPDGLSWMDIVAGAVAVMKQRHEDAPGTDLPAKVYPIDAFEIAEFVERGASSTVRRRHEIRCRR